MAIKIGGTTVIDDSANITTSVGGFKTVGGTAITGSGNIEAGASTTYGAVGTYAIAHHQHNGASSNFNGGATKAGSALRGHQNSHPTYPFAYATKHGEPLSNTFSAGLSGTWRHMAPRAHYYDSSSYWIPTLWVRIS